jgi:hypothetical protein
MSAPMTELSFVTSAPTATDISRVGAAAPLAWIQRGIDDSRLPTVRSQWTETSFRHPPRPQCGTESPPAASVWASALRFADPRADTLSTAPRILLPLGVTARSAGPSGNRLLGRSSCGSPNRPGAESTRGRGTDLAGVRNFRHARRRGCQIARSGGLQYDPLLS